jgi:3-phenylpropionate/trans-cinnamate dioxygenase ferredoxin subunit
MAWHQVASAEEIREDEATAVTVGQTHIALIRLGDQVYGTSNVCTHQFALMSDGFVEDGCIECPLHQARFDIASGERKDGPECTDLKIFPVRVEAGLVYVHCD